MRVGLIGAGNMARALARGWGEPVLCSDAGSGRAQALVDELGGEAFSSNLEVARRADLVILCHKPAQLPEVAEEIAGEAKAVVSILTNTWTPRLRTAFDGTPTFRLMPNTAVELRRGVTCYARQPDSPADLEHQVIDRFGRLGSVIEVPEAVMDAAAAITAVGPAYLALVAEAQVDAAIRHGVKASLAGRLVAETMGGTAALLARRDYDTLAVRRAVTSPAGTTSRGLAALERGGLRVAFQDAMDAVVDWGKR
jgi:pyrroline-5-carboxylate reductase